MLLQIKDVHLKLLRKMITPVMVLALLLLQGFGNLYAQGVSITGSASDAANGEPLIGVNVIIKGTT